MSRTQPDKVSHTQPDKVVYDIHILMDIFYFLVYFC